MPRKKDQVRLTPESGRLIADSVQRHQRTPTNHLAPRRRSHSPQAKAASVVSKFIKSVTHDGGGAFTIVLNDVLCTAEYYGVTTSILISETTLKYSVSSNTVIYLFPSLWNENIFSTAKWYWYGSNSGVGNDTATDQVEFLSANLAANEISIATYLLLRSDGSFTEYDQGDYPEFKIKPVTKEPYLEWNGPTGESTTPTTGTITLGGLRLPASRIRQGVGTLGYGYWGGYDRQYSANIAVSSDDTLCFGLSTYDQEGQDGNPTLQVGNSGLDTYEIVGYIKTDANGNLQRLSDYTGAYKFTPLGITDSFTIDTPRGTETLEFIDGILVKRT